MVSSIHRGSKAIACQRYLNRTLLAKALKAVKMELALQGCVLETTKVFW